MRRYCCLLPLTELKVAWASVQQDILGAKFSSHGTAVEALENVLLLGVRMEGGN